MTRILVVDDDKDIRESLRDIMEHEGYDVSIAANGNEAVRIFEEQEADLIIVDIFMPEKDGIDTIIDLNRQYHDVKIIAISAGNPFGKKDLYLGLAKKIGASHTFEKPLNIEKLLAAIKEMLGT